jgi:hypothetical protein
MELEQIANVVEILGVLALIAAIIFGWIQVRQHRNDSTATTPGMQRSWHWPVRSKIRNLPTPTCG